MHKMRMFLFVASAVFAHTTVAFSQTTSSPVTREGVVAEMAQLRDAGYNAGSDHNAYPRNIQAAEAKVSGRNGASAYGDAGGGTVASGSRMSPNQAATTRSIYSGH
jgi:Domain of unknown function (DUF4148)